jgi:hypothetical protein
MATGAAKRCKKEKKHPWKEKTGRERGAFTAGYSSAGNFQSISSFPLDTEVNRWAA